MIRDAVARRFLWQEKKTDLKERRQLGACRFGSRNFSYTRASLLKRIKGGLTGCRIHMPGILIKMKIKTKGVILWQVMHLAALPFHF